MENTAETPERVSTFYNPSSITGIFNNALNNNLTRSIIQVKGIYLHGKGISYGGNYYDQLKDENSDACITLIVPAILRISLIPHHVIEGSAYLTKKMEANGARIVLQLNLMESFSQRETQYTDDQLQALKLIQKKAEAGYKDVDSFIKSKIVREEKIKVVIIIGNNAIIDNDIKHRLEEAIGFYKFQFERISLISENAIINALLAFDEDADIIVLARGGGENLGIFDKPIIAKTALSLNSYFLTAIGHEVDKTLVQKVADKGFITPSHLGQYFNDIYNNTIAEIQDSKAKLVDDITKQLQVNYEHQIKNLKEQAANEEASHKRRIQELNLLSAEKVRLAKEGNTSARIYWALIFVAIVMGILIGKLLNF